MLEMLLTQTGLTNADLVLLAIIIFGLPIEAEIVYKIAKPRILKGGRHARLSNYLYGIVTLWLLAIAIVLVWGMSGRDWAALGFKFTDTPPTLIASSLAALIACLFLGQLIVMMTNASARNTYRKALDGLGDTNYLAPTKRSEYVTFLLLGVTAGITEEIIFRGFLIWALATIIGLWPAALLSLLLFVIMHRYQGMAGMIQVAILGTLITGIYLVTESLYPVIALHVAVDVLHGLTFWRVGRTSPLQEQITEISQDSFSANRSSSY